MDSNGNAKQPLGFYLKAVQIVRATDEFLEKKNVAPGDHNNLKFYLAYYLCAVMAQKHHPNADSILQLDSSLIEGILEKIAYPAVLHTYESLVSQTKDDRDAVAKGTELLEQLEKELAATYQEDDTRLTVKPRKKVKVRDVLKASAVK